MHHDFLRRWQMQLPRWRAGMQLMTPTSRRTLWRPSDRCPLQGLPWSIRRTCSTSYHCIVEQI